MMLFTPLFTAQAATAPIIDAAALQGVSKKTAFYLETIKGTHAGQLTMNVASGSMLSQRALTQPEAGRWPAARGRQGVRIKQAQAFVELTGAASRFSGRIFDQAKQTHAAVSLYRLP